MSIYSKIFSTRTTPQSEPIPGLNQVANSAGGFSFPVDMWARLDRFLILGSEGGSYYASEQKLVKENATSALTCLQTDGLRTVKRIVEISKEGRAPKNDQAIFLLAMALKLGDAETKAAAKAAVPEVCRIGTHIFQLAEDIKAFGGWGRTTRKAIANWYNGQPPERLAHNLVKYQNRNGWRHTDLLRKAHAKPGSDEHATLFRWLVKDGNLASYSVDRFKKGSKTDVKRKDTYEAVGAKMPDIIEGFMAISKAEKASEAVKLIEKYNLPREVVPTILLKSPEVWEALLKAGKGMPYTAMIRNLGKMSEVGLLAPMSEASKFVVNRLNDADGLKEARVHPLSILMAQSVYASGHGMRGSLSWVAVPQVIDALNDAFYKAFKSIEPTGKRHLLGVDVSGSMGGGNVGGTPLTPREAASALALVTAATEQQYHIMAFTGGFVPLDITPKMRLDSVVNKVSHLGFDRTDCALPMLYAETHKIPVDTFVVYTDSETWAGDIHPIQALQNYRRRMGIPSKLVVVGLVSNGFSIADPNDGGMMDVVGFDTAAPSVMADFIRA